MPARDVIPLGAFWPVERSGDAGGHRPSALRSHYESPIWETGCVEIVTVGLKAERMKRTGLDRIPPAQRAAHCRRVLDGVRPPSLPGIAPVG